MGCGRARASRPDARGAAADTVHLVRVLVSIAEFTTSTPAGWRRGGAASGSNRGCHASRRCCAAEQRTRYRAPAAPSSPRCLPPSPPDEESRGPLGAEPLPGRAARPGPGTWLGTGTGLSPRLPCAEGRTRRQPRGWGASVRSGRDGGRGSAGGPGPIPTRHHHLCAPRALRQGTPRQSIPLCWAGAQAVPRGQLRGCRESRGGESRAAAPRPCTLGC